MTRSPVALLEKSSNTSTLEDMIGVATEYLMALESETLCDASRRAERRRITQRDGYRNRDWHTRAETVELRIPKLRGGSCFPSLLEPHRRAEEARTAVIQKAYYIQESRPA